MPGTFIVFEGGEGSGKTTHAKLLADFLRAQGKTVTLTLEPGGTQFGTAMRGLILSKAEYDLTPRAELLCFLAARAQHVAEVIQPRLEKGEIVICDRFSGSTFAYQLGGRSLPQPELVKAMEAYARMDLKPDAVVYLDIDPESGIMRKKQGGQELDRLDSEALQFHQNVHQYFLQLAQEENWITIPTEGGTQQENQQRIRDAVSSLFNK
ncbi:MAG: dTMP kinase [Candidatus Kerfeldbacteria bacterium]|nr:dTMP kinase [Candidatus Kerfeldbacteria bacterium]